MQERDIFVLAEQALTRTVDAIKESDWTREVTTDITPKGGSLRKIINYHAWDDAWVPDTLSGKTIEEVGDKYGTIDNDLLGADPKAEWRDIVDKSIDAALALKPEDMDRMVHLSYGEYPVREYLKHITSFRGLRAFTIARFIGADTNLAPELVKGMWDEFAPEVDEWRKMGVFGPEVEVPVDSTLQAKLLGLVGIDPAG